ncbi:DUF1127 domain-containing protein [Amaricoccus sp.]|uniref:DUF1127 domain-containing protein n=1 Tax=Amaricoccus sp. TaxID=1872485 RepID=UPI001B54696D|nr:DUF1127 domain-containing protein [Amaricoccus sp.]MBP7243293.1 DUF1127 domain-containing protein [Amaricoccus sp.]
MAHAITHLDSPFHRFGLVARVRGLVARIADAIAEHRAYRSVLEELNSLTDRELADLGLHRASIAGIAREAARTR